MYLYVIISNTKGVKGKGMNQKTSMICVGSGSAFTLEEGNYQSNFLIQKDNAHLLIDCGGDVRWGLKKLNLTSTDIEAVFISHLHADHIGGLEWLAFTTLFNPFAEKPIMFVKDQNFANDLWNKSLRGGLSSVEFRSIELESYFKLQKVNPKTSSFYWRDIEFEVIQTIHTLDNKEINPSYGLRFNLNGKKIWFSGDTQYAPHQYRQLIEEADIILHDCETSPYPSNVHAHYDDLKKLSKEIKKKMYLYHYQEPPKDALNEGFAGVLKPGDIL